MSYVVSKFRVFCRLHRDRRGNEVLQSVLLVALAAIIGIGLYKLADSAGEKAQTSAQELLDKSSDFSVTATVTTPPGNGTSND